MLPRWDRDAAGQLISRYRVTGWTNIPTMVIDFLANPRLAEYDLSSLRAHRRRRRGDAGGGRAAAAGAVRPALHRRLRPDRDHGAVAHQPAATGPSSSAWAFRSSTPTRAWSIRRRCSELPAGRGRARSSSTAPQVFHGYWNDPRRPPTAFVELDGKRFFRTGDLGHMDEDGYFFITDRLKRMINATGFKVWPAEVEAMMYQHPAIQEAASSPRATPIAARP